MLRWADGQRTAASSGRNSICRSPTKIHATTTSAYMMNLLMPRNMTSMPSTKCVHFSFSFFQVKQWPSVTHWLGSIYIYIYLSNGDTITSGLEGKRTDRKRSAWLSYDFTSLSTRNMLFRRRRSQPISWLGTQETKPNTTKASNTGRKLVGGLGRLPSPLSLKIKNTRKIERKIGCQIGKAV